jgi:hypothetical protein
MFQITKIQNKTNNTLNNLKFTKQTQNNLGIAGKAFCNCKNSDGRFLDTGTVAARLLYMRPPLATRRHKKDRRQGRSTMVSSPLHFHRQRGDL